MGWSLIPSNIPGRTKRTVASSLTFVGYCVGNMVGSQIFQSKDAVSHARNNNCWPCIRSMSTPANPCTTCICAFNVGVAKVYQGKLGMRCKLWRRSPLDMPCVLCAVLPFIELTLLLFLDLHPHRIIINSLAHYLRCPQSAQGQAHSERRSHARRTCQGRKETRRGRCDGFRESICTFLTPCDLALANGRWTLVPVYHVRMRPV